MSVNPIGLLATLRTLWSRLVYQHHPVSLLLSLLLDPPPIIVSVVVDSLSPVSSLAMRKFASLTVSGDRTYMAG